MVFAGVPERSLAVADNVGVLHSTEHYDYENEKRWMHILSGGKGPAYQPGAWARKGPATVAKRDRAVANSLHEVAESGTAAGPAKM